MVDLITLAQAGPAAILLVGIVLLFRAFVSGAIVAGYLYKALLEKLAKSEARVDSLTEKLFDLGKVAANGKPPDAGPPPHG